MYGGNGNCKAVLARHPYSRSVTYASPTGDDVPLAGSHVGTCHFTIQSRELLDRAAADFSHAIYSGATRRNLTVDAGDIPTRPGTRIRIDTIELEVVRVSAPCRLLDDWIGPGAARARSINVAARVFRVLTSGPIRVGDGVHLLPAD